MLKFDCEHTLQSLMEQAAQDLAAQLDTLGVPGLAPALELRGDGATVIRALAAVDEAAPGALTFANNAKFLAQAEAAGASAVIAPPAVAAQAKIPALATAEPRLVFAVLLGLMGRADAPAPVAGEAFFADRASALLGEGVVIGPQAYIGPNVKIGARTVIAPQAYLDEGVEIGEDCVIHPRAVLRRGVRVGSRCQIHVGAVIGEDGFGYTQLPDPGRGRLIHFKNAHLGGVVIEDDVEIGAQTSIDRGLVSDTVIGRGSKLDNLVQIGHNVKVGQDCVIVSQVGVGGHSVIGDRVFLLGQVGLGPGVVIGADAIVTAQSGLGSGELPSGRRAWSGTPLRASDEAYQIMALSASQLPKVRSFFQKLKKSASFDELKKAFFDDGETPKGEKK
ncbi:MAG: UDP-3-O-(3-hydroxymyristoyl)glucosamine N-acyltransferase [Candidatus Adiutrix sp.]|jgi:UDP-3-O-[3-hydroxymyristoyl] glucosamine N-acyltransferase|nr:UDP-3-O-(3-hydroxymyristoyl)glucosamine N-acyltransferase [Candidatus Adiutrix sp.]